MRDPDLLVRAQLAASALEGAWQRWRVGYGHMADPMPAVSSYVGYSLQEPWGQPRVVFGIAAEDAERLAALLERHDSGGAAYAAVATQPVVRDLPARTGAAAAPLPVPRQAPSAPNMQVGQPLADMLRAGDNSGYDEPVYRQAAAAMKEAAAARENASRARTDSAEPANTPLSRDDSGSLPANLPAPTMPSDRSVLAELVSPEWMGSLAMAAFTARAEAEARIRAARSGPDVEPGHAAESGAEADDAGGAGLDDVQAADSGDDRTAGGEDSLAALPQVYATDLLAPLPRPEVAAVAHMPDVEEPAGDLGKDARGRDAGGRDAGGRDAGGRDAGAQDVDEQDAGDDLAEHDDLDAAPSAESGGQGTGIARRGRVTRGYPIARLSKPKRPGASSQPAGS